MLLTNYILTLTLSLLKMGSALGLEEESEECGGALSCIPFVNITAALTYFGRCSYPTHKLKVDCLLSSCPALNATCPFASNGCVDEAALTRTVSILNQCVGQDKLICGINMSHTEQVRMSFTTAQLIPPEVASGIIEKTPGTGYVDNLSTAKFTVISAGNSLVTMSIRAPTVVSYCSHSANFSVPRTSVLRSVRQLIPTSFFSFPNVKGYFPLNISFTCSIDLSCDAPSVETLDDQSVFQVIVSNFVTDQLGRKIHLEQTIVDLYNKALNAAFKTSPFLSVVYNFLSTYAALGLRAAQLNCP